MKHGKDYLKQKPFKQSNLTQRIFLFILWFMSDKAGHIFKIVAGQDTREPHSSGNGSKTPIVENPQPAPTNLTREEAFREVLRVRAEKGFTRCF
jgi:hypothetical protein